MSHVMFATQRPDDAMRPSSHDLGRSPSHTDDAHCRGLRIFAQRYDNTESLLIRASVLPLSSLDGLRSYVYVTEM